MICSLKRMVLGAEGVQVIRKTECVEEVGMFGKGVEDLEWVGKVGNGWGRLGKGAV